MGHSPAPLIGEQPIVDELASIGFGVGSLSELRRSGLRYREAVPTLVDWLEKARDPKLKGEIVRALSVPWATPFAVQALIEEFCAVDTETDPTGFGLRWTIGSALEVLFDDLYFDSFVELVVDQRHGKARQMLVLGLAKSNRLEMVEVLLGLVDDPDVDGHAIKSLAKLGVAAARPAFESKLMDSRSWVRNEARKGLEKLDR